MSDKAEAELDLQQELIRAGALRQLRHNDGSPGFVFAYDVDITNRFLAALKAQPVPTEAQGVSVADRIRSMASEEFIPPAQGEDSALMLEAQPLSKLVITMTNIEMHNFGFRGQKPGSFTVVEVIELMKLWATTRLREQLDKQTSDDFQLENNGWDSYVNYKKERS